MELINRVENAIHVVSLEGDLTDQEIGQFEAWLQPSLDQSMLNGIVVNLRKVDRIDSTGIGMIVFLFRKKQKKFALCELNPHTNDVLQRIQLHKILSIYPTEEEALKGLSGVS